MRDTTATPPWACPHCPAKAGEFCRKKTGRWMLQPHRSRLTPPGVPKTRWRNTTPNPVDEQSQLAIQTLPRNIWTRIEFTPQCWTWRGAVTSSGYGCVGYEGHSRSTHRLVYELLGGSVPDGRHLDHLCLNKLCCKPAHLEPVTPKQNANRHNIAKLGNVGHRGTPDPTYRRVIA